MDLKELAEYAKKAAELPENHGEVIWQWLTKAHIDPAATDDDWEEFVHDCEAAIADEISGMVKQAWQDWTP